MSGLSILGLGSAVMAAPLLTMSLAAGYSGKADVTPNPGREARTTIALGMSDHQTEPTLPYNGRVDVCLPREMGGDYSWRISNASDLVPLAEPVAASTGAQQCFSLRGAKMGRQPLELSYGRVADKAPMRVVSYDIMVE